MFRGQGPGQGGDRCLLTFRGEKLHHVTGLLPLGLPLATGSHWTGLAAKLGAGTRPLLGALMQRGEGFHTHVRLPSGELLGLDGRVSGLCALVGLRRTSPGENLLHARLSELDTLSSFRLRAELSPVAIIEYADDGTIRWSNAASASLANVAVPATDGQLLLRSKEGAPLGWHAVTSFALPAGGRLVYLENIEGRIRAERALEGFMSTLANTFAHLADGLAIFDQKRQLCLFNPALSEMFGLEPAALAGRPSLKQFLAALRDRRMIPEPANFTKWRDRLIAATSSLTGASHTEDWSLPSGHILRLTVRPHPDGAVAFVFVDISRNVALERSYRDELELGQTTLERLSEGAAIFAASGRLVFANPAFCELTRHDAFADLAGDSIDTVLEKAEAALGAGPAWEAFRAYVLDPDRPDRLDGMIGTGPGGHLLRASALPGGSTLLCLSAIPLAQKAPQAGPGKRALSRVS